MNLILYSVAWYAVVWKSGYMQMVDGNLVERGFRHQLQLFPDRKHWMGRGKALQLLFYTEHWLLLEYWLADDK